MTKCIIKAPGKGWIGSLDEAPDPVFSGRIIGDGLLFDPMEGELRAPCAGEVISIARTKHAVTLGAANGAKILIHVGIETVALEGRGFDVRVREGQRVELGDLLISFDIDLLANSAKSLLTPVVIANGDDFDIVRRIDDGAVSSGDFIMEVSSRTGDTDVSAPVTSAQTADVRILLPLAHGLHARPAARLVEAAKKFNAEVSVAKGSRVMSARSVVSMMGLGAQLGDEIVISAVGPDAHAAVSCLSEEIKAGLGEEPAPMPEPGKMSRASTVARVKIEPVALDGTGVLSGVTGASGLVMGKVFQLTEFSADIPEQGASPDQERAELAKAIGDVRRTLEHAASAGGEQQEEILNAHLALLDDPALTEAANRLIADGKSAAFAWREASRGQEETLIGLGDARMAERAADIRDLEVQVLSALLGKCDADQEFAAGDIVVADELLPSQFIRLAAAGIGGLCTASGGPTAHVSILAADKGVPALVAVGPRVLTIPNGTELILEADRGVAHVAPKPDKVDAIEKAIVNRRLNQAVARASSSEPCRTADGERIEIFANLGSSAEAGDAVRLGAEGCGLLRSEFLFLGRQTPPSEDEQREEYQAIADGLGGRPLVIRTLDIGGDKPVPFIDLPQEENPALGLRGVRISLQYPDLLKTQFRAILSVKSAGPVRIMLPMIISLTEMTQARKILDEACSELGVVEPVSLGVMIETPASAVLADTLAKEADFFSIGTNDLTQYVLAIDRMSATLAPRMDTLHPAVLRMIKATADAGAAHGKWVGVCGASACDLVAAPLLIGLGVKELSSTAARLPEVKAFLRTVNYKACQNAARQAINLSSPEEVREFVRAEWPHLEDWT